MAKLQKDSSNHSLISLFNNNCRFLDDILIVNNPNFLTFGKQIYSKKFTVNNANIICESCQFFDLDISQFQGNTRLQKIVNRQFYFLDGDIPLTPSFGVYISQLVRFVCICINVTSMTVIS